MALLDALARTHELHVADGVTVLVRRDWADRLPVAAMLDGLPLEQWGEVVPHDLRGRATVHVLRVGGQEIVAKALRRGGALGSLARTVFLDSRRPLREADLAERLRDRGVDTPPVVAARVTRTIGPLYRLELATQRCVGHRDLAYILRAHPSRGPAVARAAGRLVRHLHDLGLVHRDLQMLNLLAPLDGRGEVIVIDLDRCHLTAGPLDLAGRVTSLTRLARSCVKRSMLPHVAGGRALLSAGPVARAFFTAYGACEGVRRAALLVRVRRRLAAALAWRRLGGRRSAYAGRNRFA